MILIIVSMFLYHLIALHFDSKRTKYILKPGTMILIIALAIYGSCLGKIFAKWVFVAICFFLVEDVLLMLEERWFIHGLISFFIAYVFYIIAFWNSFILHIMSKTSLLFALSLIVFSIRFFLFLLRHVKE